MNQQQKAYFLKRIKEVTGDKLELLAQKFKDVTCEYRAYGRPLISYRPPINKHTTDQFICNKIIKGEIALKNSNEILRLLKDLIKKNQFGNSFTLLDLIKDKKQLVKINEERIKNHKKETEEYNKIKNTIIKDSKDIADKLMLGDSTLATKLLTNFIKKEYI